MDVEGVSWDGAALAVAVGPAGDRVGLLPADLAPQHLNNGGVDGEGGGGGGGGSLGGAADHSESAELLDGGSGDVGDEGRAGVEGVGDVFQL